jgi:hypothetical protein
MTPKYTKVSEIADTFRVSADAVYLWIRQGKIPKECVVRVAGTVRVDAERFEQRLRSGGLYQRPGRKRTMVCGRDAELSIAAIAEDSITTIGNGPETEHRWTSETGSVLSEHPFSPEMVAITK